MSILAVDNDKAPRHIRSNEQGAQPVTTTRLEDLKKTQEVLEAACARHSRALQDMPKGTFGITPDDVKFSTEYRTTKMAFDVAFARLREFNRRYSASLRRAAP